MLQGLPDYRLQGLARWQPTSTTGQRHHQQLSTLAMDYTPALAAGSGTLAQQPTICAIPSHATCTMRTCQAHHLQRLLCLLAPHLLSYCAPYVCWHFPSRMPAACCVPSVLSYATAPSQCILNEKADVMNALPWLLLTCSERVPP